MPAHRKPSKLLELTGAYDHNPDRRRAPEPEPAGPLGEPPSEGLNPGALKVWHEISKAAGGWLTEADRHSVEVAAVLMDQFRRRVLPVPGYAALRGALGVLGLNPSDRSRISVAAKEKPKSQFAALAEEAAGFNADRPN